MKSLFAHISFCLIVFSSLQGAQAASPDLECPTALTKGEFQTRGGTLSTRFVPSVAKKICVRDSDKRVTCVGATTMHLLVRKDGTVRFMGADATGGAGLSTVLLKAVERVRFTRPRVNGKPVCVYVDAGWVSAEPGKIRIDWP